MTKILETLPILYTLNKSQMKGLFRYPGGKSWFVPYLKHWLLSFNVKPTILVEPFAGSGVVSLNAVMDKLVEEVILVEKDEEISAVWKTVLNGRGEWLAQRILDFEISKLNVEDELIKSTTTVHEIAFSTILKNRVNRGGIIAPGAGRLKNGEANRGLASRWYPQTLNDRIKNIISAKNEITFIEGDGLDIMEELQQDSHVAFFIDPPYPNAGKRLYKHSEIDHEKIFELANLLVGNFLMTYDDSDIIKRLASIYNFDIIEIHMKNTHHNKSKELLISKDLSWFRKLFLNINTPVSEEK